MSDISDLDRRHMDELTAELRTKSDKIRRLRRAGYERADIARYLGIAQDEIGSLSSQAEDPEKVSGICAVLAETDVINMVSRGITAPNILKGIHLSMASRLVRLLKVIGGGENIALMTGGLAHDEGLVAALREEMENQKIKIEVRTSPDSIYAGAIGAALWGAFRHAKLARLGQLAMAS